MNPKIKDYKYPLPFYLLATVFPWSFWGIAAYISHSRTLPYPAELASLFAFVGLLSPVVVALGMTRNNPALLRDMGQRLFAVRSGKPVYWLLTFCLMPASILLAQLISLLFGYPASQFAFSENYSFTSGVFPVAFLLIAAPAIEELAWHSYGTDCLCQKYSLLKASLIFAAFWGIWHLPLSFIKDYYHSNLVEGGWIHSANFLLSLFPFVIIMNWLYYRTGRSILSAIIFHITAGYFNEIFATHPDSKVIQTGVLTVVAIIIVWRDKPLFRPAPKGLASGDREIGASRWAQHPAR